MYVPLVSFHYFRSPFHVQKRNYIGLLSILYENGKVCSFQGDGCAILISFKSFVIFSDFVLISTKVTTLLKEMRIAQLSS